MSNAPVCAPIKKPSVQMRAVLVRAGDGVTRFGRVAGPMVPIMGGREGGQS